MTSHAKQQHAARTKALRAPEPKLWKVSVEGVCEMTDHLVQATSAYEAMKKTVAAKYPGLRLDPLAKTDTYKNERGADETQSYMRGQARGWCVWAQEAEVIS